MKAKTQTRGKGRRTSAVGRLPRVLRDKVNQMIDDGVPYNDIIRKLKDESAVQLKYHALSVWRRGGHQDWLNEQRRVAQMDKNRELVLKILRRRSSKPIAEKALDVAAAQIYELLMNFQLESLKEKLADDPEIYPEIVETLTKVSEGGLKHQRHRADLEKANAEKALNDKANARDTDEAMDEVLKALRVM
jgi:hypothetical protein